MTEAAEPQAGGTPGIKRRNLVICCDGTGNEVTGNLSNVLKLFRILKKDEDQRVYYHPGVGTVGTQNEWQRLKTNLRSYWGLATGTGLDDNILDAYRWLAANYRDERDRIFLFGFSRGAYTVRALAGFIHLMGLLHPDQSGVADYALTTFKRVSGRANKRTDGTADPRADEGDAPKDGFAAARAFKRVMNARSVTIHFMGVWDTVGSMIVPGRFPLTFTLRTLPFTRHNPSVRAFRHAMAIDERRRMFRLNRWEEGQKFEADHWKAPPEGFPDQDCKQLWFAGVHSDIGGGYPERQSGLAKWPLIWMVEEAISQTHGLRIDTRMFGHLAYGRPLPGGMQRYVPPDALGPMHRSLHSFWWLLEWLPKSACWREWERYFSLYFPGAEPRPIPGEQKLHSSVEARLAATAPGGEVRRGLVYPPYAPPNLDSRRSLPTPESRWSRVLRPFGLVLYLLFLAAIVWLLAQAVCCLLDRVG